MIDIGLRAMPDVPRLPVAAVLVMLLLAACNQQDEPDRLPTTAAIAKSAPEPRDPCRLVSAGEAESLLGATLAGAPFRAGAPNHEDAGVPRPDGPACWYETADFRNVAVQATWSGGGALMAGVGGWLAKAATGSDGLVKLQDGSELTGEWDEVRMLGCCNFMALQGDSVVEIDFGGSLANAGQAGVLADAALRRLSAPLPVDGRDGIVAAEKRQTLRPRPSGPCSLWSAADIEATVGILRGTPEASGDDCTYTFETDSGRSNQFVSTVTWRNGYRRYRESNQMLSSMLGAALNEMGAGDSNAGKTAIIDGPWDAAQQSAIQFNSVHHDVQIAVRQRGMSLDELRALLGRAYEKLDNGGKGKP